MMRALRVGGIWLAVLAAASCRDGFGPIPDFPSDVEDTFGGVRNRWYQAQILWPTARPVIVDDAVVFGTGDGLLVSRSRTNGAARWTASIATPGGTNTVNGLEIIRANDVIVAAISRQVVAVEASSGQKRWTYLPPLDTVLNPAPGNGYVGLSGLETDGETVFVPAWGASVSAVDVGSGATRWVWKPQPAPQFRSGAEGARLSGDTLFVNVWWGLNSQLTQAQAGLVALDKNTGEELWRVLMPYVGIGTTVRGRPQLWQNKVIVGLNGGRIYAVNRATQSVTWQYAPTSSVLHGTVAGPTVFGDVVYADAGDDHVIALRASDGSTLWKTFTRGSATAEFLVTDRRIYVPVGMFMEVFDRASGHYLVRNRQPNEIKNKDDTPYGVIGSLFATPAVAVGREIYITVSFGAWSFFEP